MVQSFPFAQLICKYYILPCDNFSTELLISIFFLFSFQNSSPLWEDFIIKATKLHACLRLVMRLCKSLAVGVFSHSLIKRRLWNWTLSEIIFVLCNKSRYETIKILTNFLNEQKSTRAIQSTTDFCMIYLDSFRLLFSHTLLKIQ